MPVREVREVRAPAPAQEVRVEEHVRALGAHLVRVPGAVDEPRGLSAVQSPRGLFGYEVVGEHVRHLGPRRPRVSFAVGGRSAARRAGTKNTGRLPRA